MLLLSWPVYKELALNLQPRNKETNTYHYVDVSYVSSTKPKLRVTIIIQLTVE